MWNTSKLKRFHEGLADLLETQFGIFLLLCVFVWCSEFGLRRGCLWVGVGCFFVWQRFDVCLVAEYAVFSIHLEWLHVRRVGCGCGDMYREVFHKSEQAQPR
jgi:hypothetical protein